jgi:hypothetical protein
MEEIKMSKANEANVLTLSKEVTKKYNQLYKEWQKAACNRDPRCEELRLQLRSILDKARTEQQYAIAQEVLLD